MEACRVVRVKSELAAPVRVVVREAVVGLVAEPRVDRMANTVQCRREGAPRIADARIVVRNAKAGCLTRGDSPIPGNGAREIEQQVEISGEEIRVDEQIWFHCLTFTLG